MITKTTGPLLIGVLIALAAACGGESSSSSGTGGTTGTTSSGTTSATTGAGGAAAQPAICEKYLDCLSIVAPELVGAATDNYGTQGSCWTKDADTIELCTQECASGLDKEHGMSPSTTECNADICMQNADCLLASKPACLNGTCLPAGCAELTPSYDQWIKKYCACQEHPCDPNSTTGVIPKIRANDINLGCAKEFDALMACGLNGFSCSDSPPNSQTCPTETQALAACESSHQPLGCPMP